MVENEALEKISGKRKDIGDDKSNLLRQTLNERGRSRNGASPPPVFGFFSKGFLLCLQDDTPHYSNLSLFRHPFL
jgi:hypothetical protein